MRSLRAWLVTLLTFGLFPLSASAQELKTINKPGQMLANVTTDDEAGKPLKLKKGEKVTVIYNRDDWMWVKTKNGRGGWVLRKEVKVLDAPAGAPAQGKAEEAKKKKEEEATAKKAAAEETKRKKAEEAAARKGAAEEAKKKKEEEAAAKKAAVEEAKRKKAEEAAEKKAEAEAYKKAAEFAKKAAADARKNKAAAAEAAAGAAPAPDAAAAGETNPLDPPPATKAVETAPPAAAAPAAAEVVPIPVTAPLEPLPPTPVAPPPAPGFITVRASEAGAEVLVDGRKVGHSPVKRLAVEGGKHSITVVKDGFTPALQNVEVNGNEVHAMLALAPYPAVMESQQVAVWRNRTLGFVSLGAGLVLAALSSMVGVGGALMWALSATAAVYSALKATSQLDATSQQVVAVLGHPSGVPMFAAAGVTLAAPLLALVFAGAGGLTAAIFLATAGDPARYAAFQE
jgi:hypothetical protein